MNFFTEGKTNWKYILIVLILAVIVGGGILSWQWRMAEKEVKAPEEKPEEKPEEIIISSPAKGEKWVIGETYQIRWTPTGPAETVTIQLLDLQRRAPYQTVWQQEVPNNGIYSFTVPLDLYQIKYAQIHIPELKLVSEGFSIIKDETADWKTYRNEKYGFKFKYPPNIFLKDRLEHEEKGILLGDKEFPKPEIASWYHSPITIEITNIEKNNARIEALTEKSTSTIEIAGRKASLIEGKYPSYPGLPSIYRMKIIIISEKNLTIIIKENYAGEISDWNEILEKSEMIISTLQFIEDETANWKTYKNEEYGFEFKYPKNSELKEGTRFSFDLSFNLPFTPGTKLNDKRMSIVIKENTTLEGCFGLIKWHGVTEVNGIEFYYIPGFKWEHAMGGKSFFASDYFTMKDNNCIGLEFRLGLSDPTGFVDPSVPIPPDPPEGDLDTEVFEKMLSTFRFLE